MKVVINTGPLLFLSKINRLPILQKFGRIFVPKGVISEIKYKQDDVSAAVIKTLDEWLKIKSVKDKYLLNVLMKELNGGEGSLATIFHQDCTSRNCLRLRSTPAATPQGQYTMRYDYYHS